jgi:Tfp pilus assembly protein PilF
VAPVAALWGALVTAGFLAAFVWAVRRHRGLALVLGLVPVTYAVVSAFPLTPQVFIAERFTYLPSVGACLAAGWVLCRGAERLAARARRAGAAGETPAPDRTPGRERPGRLAVGALGGLVLLLAARSAVRSLDWRSDASLARATIATAPDSPLGLRGQAQEEIRRGNLEAARILLERSLGANPRRSEPYALLVPLYLQRGDVDRAVALARQAAAEVPQRQSLLHSLAGALWQAGRLEEAERLLRQVTASHPAFFPARLALGGLLLQTGRSQEALDQFQAASRLDPGQATAWYGMARAAQALGRPEEARGYAERGRAAQAARPADPGATRE